MLSLETEEECLALFSDLCTPKEINTFVQRLEVARMLKEGMTYQDVQSESGASTATISRVKKLLDYGSEGYNRVLERIKE